MARPRSHWLVESIEVAVIAFVLALALRTYVVGTYVVDGNSMNPTLTDGEWVAIWRRPLLAGDPVRGDIIVFRYPRDPRREFIKRVIGLPGDVVELRGGRVLVNGSLLAESHPVAPDRSSHPETRVPEGQLFVLGDNRRLSEDSRAFGLVPLDHVSGEAFLVLWPPGGIRLIISSGEGGAGGR